MKEEYSSDSRGRDVVDREEQRRKIRRKNTVVILAITKI